MSKKRQTSQEDLMKLFLEAKTLKKSLISKDEILRLEYDNTWIQFDKAEFLPIEETINMDVYSPFCYVEWINCRETKHQFSVIRIADIGYVTGLHSFFICPAIKVDGMAKTKKVPPVVNRLGLKPGEVVSIDDLPKVELNFNNSRYDAKLGKRVPILVDVEYKSETKKSEPKQSKVKVESEMINNQDIKIEGKTHSSEFLDPMICTRLWVLSIGTDTGWVWYAKDAEGYKNRYEYYVRPEILTEEWMRQYDRGGAMFTKAYFKWEFPNLCNEVLSHHNLLRIKSQWVSEKKIELNCLIDAFLINVDGLR